MLAPSPTIRRTGTDRRSRGQVWNFLCRQHLLHLVHVYKNLSFISLFTLFTALVCGYYVTFMDASCLAHKTRKVSTLALAIIRSPCSATSYSATA